MIEYLGKSKTRTYVNKVGIGNNINKSLPHNNTYVPFAIEQDKVAILM